MQCGLDAACVDADCVLTDTAAVRTNPKPSTSGHSVNGWVNCYAWFPDSRLPAYNCFAWHQADVNDKCRKQLTAATAGAKSPGGSNKRPRLSPGAGANDPLVAEIQQGQAQLLSWAEEKVRRLMHLDTAFMIFCPHTCDVLLDTCSCVVAGVLSMCISALAIAGLCAQPRGACLSAPGVAWGKHAMISSRVRVTCQHTCICCCSCLSTLRLLLRTCRLLLQMHIAFQVYDLVDKHIRELDEDLKSFASEVDMEAQSLGLGDDETACDRLGLEGGARVRGTAAAAAAAAAAGQGRQKRKTAGRRKGGEAGGLGSTYGHQVLVGVQSWRVVGLRRCSLAVCLQVMVKVQRSNSAVCLLTASPARLRIL